MPNSEPPKITKEQAEKMTKFEIVQWIEAITKHQLRYFEILEGKINEWRNSTLHDSEELRARVKSLEGQSGDLTAGLGEILQTLRAMQEGRTEIKPNAALTELTRRVEALEGKADRMQDQIAKLS